MQIVGYEAVTDRESAALLIAEDGAVERRRLRSGTDLEYTLGDRRCAGTVDDGTHLPCDRADAPYCDAHTSRWPCARCTGDCDLPMSACREEHAVYLAAFAPATYKVGVTRSWRLEKRLREQGADRGAHIRTVPDGRVAREIEADLAADVGDSVRIPAKVAGLHRPVDEDAWRTFLADYTVIDRFSFSYGLDLADRPVRETLATGTVRGTKGRVLVLDYGGSTYAVDLRDLVGHEARTGSTDRDLQSSLGAF